MNIPHVLGYLSRVRDKTAGSVVLSSLLYQRWRRVSREGLSLIRTWLFCFRKYGEKNVERVSDAGRKSQCEVGVFR